MAEKKTFKAGDPVKFDHSQGTTKGKVVRQTDQPHEDQGPQGRRVERQPRVHRQERQDRRSGGAQAGRASEGLTP